MLATFVIGLREGLEAALIVGIIAAFLRKNGKSLTAMWLGVVLAVILSIAVGVSLDVIEQALPQAGQEGMETVIGAIAIFFVTGMIAWMNAHARDMKRQLEAEAAQALSQAGAYALASMAFLAVLKEGFETSVFLLATFSAAQSAAWAATGAIIGLLVAVVVGWGIYVGGVRINLSRFFRITGAFLILVAAGLVITSLRTAHEAGWLNAGQQPTVNLSWLVTPGTIQSALMTGVLGIPADPRLVEVIGWFAYLVPSALFIYWPQPLRPRPRTTMRLRLATAAALGCVALASFLLYPRPHPRSPAQATIVAGNDSAARPVGTTRLTAGPGNSPAILRVSLGGAGEATLSLPSDQRRREQHDGVDSFAWVLTRTTVPAHAPPTLTLDQVVTFSGGRIPVGLNPREHPGPFTAGWSTRRFVHVWVADHLLLDAAGHDVTVVTLSGGGLQTPRALTVSGDSDPALVRSWHVSTAYRNEVVTDLNDIAAARSERRFWAVQVPVALVIAALVLAASACRILIRLRRPAEPATARTIRQTDRLVDGASLKGRRRAAH